MKKNSSIIIGLIVIAVFVGGALYLIAFMGTGSSGNGASAPGTFGNNLVGNPAPKFSLQDRNGITYSSDDLKGKNIVLFFNEGIMCYPACWNQMVALATDGRFQAPDIAVFSVVTDSPNDWQSAVTRMPDLGKANVLFDASRSVSRAFGMLAAPSSMHYGSYPGHSFVVIDKQGIVRFVFDDPNMGIDNDMVFADLQKLN